MIAGIRQIFPADPPQVLINFPEISQLPARNATSPREHPRKPKLPGSNPKTENSRLGNS